MPTAEQRYQAATDYVRRAVAAVEARGVSYTVDQVTGLIEWYASVTKTAQPRAELSRIQERWKRAISDGDRLRVARDAELLADRVQENLPGAPEDRTRTNLYKGEQQKAAPSTTYAEEADRQATLVWEKTKQVTGDLWDWLASHARAAEESTEHAGNWLLAAGVVVVAWKGLDYLHQREQGRRIEEALNTSLVHVASARR